MAIQSSINQAIGLAGAAYVATGIPKKKMDLQKELIKKQETAIKEAEAKALAQKKQRERARLYRQKKTNEAIIAGRKELINSGIGGKTLNVAIKESDKQARETTKQLYKGVRGLGK